jgi:hypothetical protein
VGLGGGGRLIAGRCAWEQTVEGLPSLCWAGCILCASVVHFTHFECGWSSEQVGKATDNTYGNFYLASCIP